MKINQLIERYHHRLSDRYGHRLLPSHRRALDAISACRRYCGEFGATCQGCHEHTTVPLSCGHRSCPQCQHHLGEAWRERQIEKLLPVTYFMVTLTIPKQLRALAWQHQHTFYDLMFKAAREALITIGRNNHAIELGMTAVLHTHKRDKDYHPHLHIIIPGGGLIRSEKRLTWKAFDQDYLVNEFALAKVYSAILLRMLFEEAIPLPKGLPNQWVAHIKNVGRGKKAIHYLSRYLYRGVISENDIVLDQENQVTFRYQDSRTRKLCTRTLPAETFLWKILKHVLPRGMRRVRDYGFLHANAKHTLNRVQLHLHVKLPKRKPPKVKMRCSRCTKPMTVEWVNPKRIPIRFMFFPATHSQNNFIQNE